ncbi:hypothetical protein F2Q69_00043970 [Brassica cretica]|uniref:Uncharacterized protein n=1 Tax=Brassica cretica TaxID=69181 RepID=A0A8S9NNH2_BRACR|nr:hypothetical protein F2Q69_00043970 [Brassica cretica]
MAKKREKNEERELDRAKQECNKQDELGELENWSSWRTGEALNSAGRSVRRLGQLDEFGVVTSSQSDQVRIWTAPTKPYACGKRAKQLESVSYRRDAYR